MTRHTRAPGRTGGATTSSTTPTPRRREGAR